MRVVASRRLYALVAAALALGCALPPVYHGTSGLDPARDPSADLDRAVAEARASGRRILIFASGDWCPWAGVWGKVHEQSPELRALLARHYVLVPVHWGPGELNPAFFARYPAFETSPQLIFLTSDGRYLHHQDLSEFERPGRWLDEVGIETLLETWARDR